MDGPAAPASDGFDRDAFERLFRHAKATVNGVELHYVVGGRGEPLVLVHGWPETWYEWRRVMPAFAERHTVIAVDLRGLGDSERAASGYDKRTLGRDVYELVAGRLGHRTFDIVGHDWGASVAFSIAYEHPEAVRRLVLSDNLLPGLPATSPAARALLDKIWHVRFMQQPGLPEALVPGRERAFYGHIYRDWTANQAAFTPDYLDEFVRAYSKPGTIETGAAYYRTLGEDAEVFARYAETKLSMPVLAVTGEKLIGQALQDQVAPYATNFRGVVIRNCGHFLPIDCPVQYGDAITAFLADPAAAAR